MSGCAGLLGIMEQLKDKELNYGLRLYSAAVRSADFWVLRRMFATMNLNWKKRR